MVTIKLELNIKKNLSKDIILHFNDLPEGLDLNLQEISSITITNVPNEIEYELSKLIFNRLEILELQDQNKVLATQIATHTTYHIPNAVK